MVEDHIRDAVVDGQADTYDVARFYRLDIVYSVAERTEEDCDLTIFSTCALLLGRFCPSRTAWRLLVSESSPMVLTVECRVPSARRDRRIIDIMWPR